MGEQRETGAVTDSTQWRNKQWTSQFDISFHWGRNADVPLSFFYLDEEEIGNSIHHWWKLAKPEVETVALLEHTVRHIFDWWCMTYLLLWLLLMLHEFLAGFHLSMIGTVEEY